MAWAAVRARGASLTIVFDLAFSNEFDEVVLRGTVESVLNTKLWGPNQSLIVKPEEEAGSPGGRPGMHLLLVGAGMNPVAELFGRGSRPRDWPVEVAVWRVPEHFAAEVPLREEFLGRAGVYAEGEVVPTPAEARSRSFERCDRQLAGRRISIGIAEPSDTADFGGDELTGTIRHVLLTKLPRGSFYTCIIELDRPMPLRGGTRVISAVGRNVGNELADLLLSPWIVVNFSAEPDESLHRPEDNPEVRVRRFRGYLGFGLAKLL